jgi:hypothetical protein
MKFIISRTESGYAFDLQPVLESDRIILPELVTMIDPSWSGTIENDELLGKDVGCCVYHLFTADFYLTITKNTPRFTARDIEFFQTYDTTWIRRMIPNPYTHRYLDDEEVRLYLIYDIMHKGRNWEYVKTVLLEEERIDKLDSLNL